MIVITKAGEIRLNESLATSQTKTRKVLHSILYAELVSVSRKR
jgi:hypothetical protein